MASMQIRPDEITKILKERIEGIEQAAADLAEVGTVLSIGDGIARVHGLENAMSMEMLELPHDVTGLALNLESDNVGAVLFGEWDKIEEGDNVKRTGALLDIPVGEQLLGRIVDPLGRPLDGKGPIELSETRPAEFKAPGVVQRQPVKEPMQTGLKAIDAMSPIGRGQRELIIRARRRGRADQVHGAVRRLRDGRALSLQRPPRAVHLRRPHQARVRLSPDVAAVAAASRPRGLSGRRLLPAFAPARAGGEAQRGARRRIA